MSRINVGVLRGGPSSEYDVSLKTGATVLQHMPDKYHAKDIFISKDGVWHVHGMPKSPEKALRHIDVVFNAMHGEYGEDGTVQKILDTHRVPYTGSGTLASAIGMNKLLAKKVFTSHGIKSPYHYVANKDQSLNDMYRYLFEHFHLPAVVKPAIGGSSIGVTLVNKYTDLIVALELAFSYSPTVLVEEYIRGREATCGVLDDFRDQKYYALLPVEIIPPATHGFFNYDAKYSGVSQEICPGNFNEEEKLAIQEAAVAAHKALGLRHYSRSDFIVTPKRGVYILEVNTLPGLTPESLFPKSIEAVGFHFPHFLDHLIQLALQK